MFGGSPVRTRAFPSWPVFDRLEEEAVLEVVRSGNWWRYSFGQAADATIQDEGPASKVGEFQQAFARFQGARYGIACSTGTAAIEIALKALGIGPGDEVVVPPYTFIATASAPLILNAVPIFCDLENDTFNLDPKRMEEAITPRTKAVVPVHFAGQAVDMDAVSAIARKHGLHVVEDAAHGHGGSWKGRGLGTIGEAGTFSFQASKNMTAGEGGMIVTDDEQLAKLCESYLWGGRVIGRPWYEHHRLGWNYRLTEFQGAILLQQLTRVECQTLKRMENGLYLNRRLASVPGIRPLHVPDYVTRHAFHIYVFRFDEAEFGIPRADFLAALAAEGISCSAGYAHPLYKNPMFLNQEFYPRGCPVNCGHYDRKLDYASFEELCPNAERACREAVWLEHRQLLGDQADMDDIADAVTKIHECRDEFAPATSR